MRAGIRLAVRPDRYSRRACAMVCLVLFLLVELVASSSALHKTIHPDADSPLHHCVVTLLSHGCVTAATAAVGPAALVGIEVFSVILPDTRLASLLDCRLSPSRAPPAA